MSPSKKTSGFTAEEKAAMKEAARERRQKGKTDGEADVQAKIAEMKGSDRKIAKRLHELVKQAAPDLSPRTWYGMPAYTKDDKVVCHFMPAQKFKSRYATIGFSDNANLDKGSMWPVSFALAELGPAEEKKVVALLKQAVR